MRNHRVSVGQDHSGRQARGERVLVTGGAGFIGSHLVLALVRLGARVAVLDNLSTGTVENLGPAAECGFDRENLHVHDVGVPAVVDPIVDRWRPEVVFHLAAQARVLPSLRDPFNDAWNNILGTISVAQAAARIGSRMVLASSGGAIYGSMSDAEPDAARLEDGPRAPVSPYGLSKCTANSYLAMYQHLYGLDSVVLNLGNVYGPRLDGAAGSGFLERMLAAAGNGEPVVVFGDGNQSRDFVFVDDAVEAFVCAARNTVTGEYNIGCGEETTVNDAVDLASELLRTTLPVRHLPVNPGEVDRVRLDPGRAARDLGWRTHVSLRTGLARTAASYGLKLPGTPMSPAVGAGGFRTETA